MRPFGPTRVNMGRLPEQRRGAEMDRAWIVELSRLAILLLSSLVAGWFTQRPLVGLAGGLTLYLIWTFYRLARLAQFLNQRGECPPPPDTGLFAPILLRIGRLQSRSRKRKRRLSRFFRRFREAAAALPDAVVILGRNDEVQWCNSAAKTLLGLSWPAASGHPLTDLVPDPMLAEYLAEGDYHNPLVLNSPLERGRTLSILVVAFGKKHQCLLMVRDITNMYNVDRMRRDFVANASHELRSPLTVIMGYLETIATDLDPDSDWQRPVTLMREQAARMADIIQDLTTLSKLEAGVNAEEVSLVRTSELLESIITDARAMSGELEHRLELDADPDLFLQGRPSELHSAFANLVTNAVIHTPRRTRICVTWSANGDSARLEVRDQGPGIPGRHLSRLTERFYRVDESRARTTGGTGLGLAIVKHVLDRHDAELRIESEIGRGSRFVCLFPTHVVTISPAEGTSS